MELSESIKIRVRFSEVDSIRMVWHGNYVTYLEDAREAFGRKYGLVQYACSRNRNQSTLITQCKYDGIFRYFGLWQSYFVCQINGKYGLLEPHKGREVIPCLQDEIYAAEDFDGIVAFKRDGKYGLYSPGHCTDAIFEEVKLQSEDYAVATIGKTFGYIDKSGNLTHSRHKAFFGSWNDIDK